jgi:hypothetical protein
MGQLIKDFALQEAELAFPTINGTGKKNIQDLPLVESSNILLPSLHITLGLMNFGRVVYQTGLGFVYLAEKFPGMSAAKFKEGVFIGPQMHQLFRDEQFYRIPSGNENRVLSDFELVVTRFLGNIKADNYKEHVEHLLLSYQKLGCSMTLKMHFQHSRLEFFPENVCRAMSTANVSIVISLQWRSDTRKSGFHVISILLLDGNKRFSGTWVPTAGEETAQLIKASQSLCIT